MNQIRQVLEKNNNHIYTIKEKLINIQNDTVD